MAEKIFVLGSNSFSGASFIACVLNRGCDVVGVSRSPEASPVFLPYRWLKPAAPRGRFHFEQLDLNCDTDRIIDCIREFQPDYVVNFAAQSMVAESWLYPDQWYQTNVVANVRLHDRLRRFHFLKKYVHVSTPEVYGNCTGRMTEEAPFNPSTPYAASRAACDLHLMTFLKQYRFPVVFNRAANVYGPGQRLYRIIPRTILFIRLGRKLQLQDGGRSVRSFIHVRDVAEATLKIAQSAPVGSIYHLATTRYTSICEIVKIICHQMKVRFEDLVEMVDGRPGQDQAYLLDSSRARRELGWSDVVGLEEGIQETIAWVDENLDELKGQPFQYVHKP